jgi:hypothetical protein
MAAPPLNHDARDVSRNTPPAKASRISARAIHVDSTDVGIRGLRLIKKQTEALYANRHAAAQKFLSTWDWPAYVKHTDLSKPEDRALGRSQGRADRQDPCPDPTPRSARSRCRSASGLLRTRTPPRPVSPSSSVRLATAIAFGVILVALRAANEEAPFGSMTPRSSPGFCWARSGEARSWWRPPRTRRQPRRRFPRCVR